MPVSSAVYSLPAEPNQPDNGESADATMIMTILNDIVDGINYAINYGGILNLVSFADITGLPTTLAGFGITNGQLLDGTLTAFAAITFAADKVPYGTGADAFSTFTFDSYMRGLMSNANEAAFKAAINLESNVDFDSYQAAQATATWEAGVGTTESKVSPAKVFAAIAASNIRSAPFAVLYHKQVSGVDGGTATSAAWRLYTINTEYDPSSLVTLSSNQFVPSVNCFVRFRATTYTTGIAQFRIYNSTGAVAVDPPSILAGAHGTDGITCISEGWAFLTAGVTYQMEYQVETTRVTEGLGFSSGWGDEIYGTIEFYRT